MSIFKSKDFLISSIISILIIVATGILGVYMSVCDACFYLHLIPFGNGFFGEPAFLTLIYYLGLFTLITLVIYGLIYLFKK
ncbi:MAG: hypothetical protein KAI79_17620 [Bacteroidales bacterium]|nr:hypothetical protein [Bacteroidales bacterium]